MVELIRSTRSRMSLLTRSTSTSVTDLVEEGQGDEPLRLLDEDLEFFLEKYIRIITISLISMDWPIVLLNFSNL